MLHPLGRASGDDSLVARLTACHQRIRRFLDLAAALAAGPGARSAAERADAAAAVHRYFATALPLHVADEDHSLAPRLAGRDPALDAALTRLTAEHAGHGAEVARLCELTARLAATPADHDALAPELATVTAALHAAFATHLALEEAVVFPAIAALPAAVQAEIARELRERRSPASEASGQQSR